MNLFSTRSIAAIFACVFAFGAATGAGAAPITIHLEDGRTLSVHFDRAAKEGVTWRLAPGDPVTQHTPMDRISHVDFPVPPAWEEAENLLADGDLDAALEKFIAISRDQFRLGYPAPGNHASLALLEALAIRQRLLDPKAIAAQAGVIAREEATLPPDRRALDPLVKSWVALSDEKWTAALESLETMKGADSEIAYLRGRALEGRGDARAAIEAYAATYTLGVGDRSEMSRDALRRSAVLLDALGSEDRFPELHAQLVLYAELFGAGALWKGAPERLAAIATTGIDAIDGMVEKTAVEPPPAAAAPPSPPEGLPPLEERDWILASELDRFVYIVGEPPFEAEGAATKTAAGWRFEGDGGKLVTGKGVSLFNEEVRLRAIFVPEKPDGILAHGPFESGGIDLYLAGGDLHFSWSRHQSGKDRKTFNLGKARLGEENRLGLNLTRRRMVRATFNAELTVDNERVPNLISFKNAHPVAVGGRAGDRFVPGDELPSFTGTIRHFSLGADRTLKHIGEKERAMFGGKNVRLTPPSPPEN